MIEKIEIFRQSEDGNKQIGWVEINGPEDIEWEFDRKDPAYPRFRKLFHKIETGKIEYPKRLVSVQDPEEFPTDTRVEDFAEPTREDVHERLEGEIYMGIYFERYYE